LGDRFGGDPQVTPALFVKAVPGVPGQQFDIALDVTEWGAQIAVVTHDGNQWTIEGVKQKVILDAATLAIRIEARDATWEMVASGSKDMLVRLNGQDIWLRLADA